MAENMERVVNGIEFSSRDGKVTWRETFSDSSVGTWNDTLLETNDLMAFQKLRKDLLAERKLNQEE